MQPGPALLLLLGLGLGYSRLPLSGAATPVPRAPSAPTAGVRAPTRGHAATLRSVEGAPSLGLLSGQASLSLRPHASLGGGVVLSGGHGLCFPRGPPRPPLGQCLHVRVLLRARRARRASPTRVHLRLSAPRRLLSLHWLAEVRHALGPLEWTFHVGLGGPQDAFSASRKSRSIAPGGRPSYAGHLARTRCPTDGPMPVVLEAVTSDGSQALASSVSCRLSTEKNCVLKMIKIVRNAGVHPAVFTRDMDISLNGTFQSDCPSAQTVQKRWLVYSLPSLSAPLGSATALDVPELQLGQDSTSMHIPKRTLSWGVYVFVFRVSLIIVPYVSAVTRSDYIHVSIVRSALKAVLLGDANVTVNFTDELILNGSMSSDPDADNPSEGLQFSWYCTTNPKNYKGDKIAVISDEVCLPEQADLKWTQAPGPVLTLLPETLKGDRVYFFRMVVERSSRTAFSDKRVHVLQGSAPTANISCTENCGMVLVLSDRFYLFLNCTNCATSRDVYTWSILSPSGEEMAFDWVGQTSTGRHGHYLSLKAFAFRDFLEAKFWISLDLATWRGVNLVLRYPFIINRAPEIGECNINPANGIAFFTKFVVQCSNFKDPNTPLTYKMIVSDLHGFGEISSLKENTLGSILYMGNEPTSPSSFLPVGVLVNHYALKIFVQVYDSLEAFSQVTLYTTVQAPTLTNSSESVLQQLLSFTTGQNSTLSTLFQKQDFLPAGYLIYIVASVLNSMKTKSTLQADKTRLREHLVNQSFTLPATTLVEASQVVTVLAKLTQKTSEFTRVARKLATERLWQANQVLQQHQQKDQHFHSEQIEIVSTGILTSLSNLLKMTARHEVADDPFYVIPALADTVLAGKVPDNETTVMRSSSFNMCVRKMEMWAVTTVVGKDQHCRNSFQPTLNVSSVPSLPANAPISVMFCEFAEDPFPWLNYQESLFTDVVGFRMTGTTANGKVLEIMPDVAEVYLSRKNLSSTSFRLTVGPDSKPDKVGAPSGKTTGAFRFTVDSRAVKELLLHIVTAVTVLFTVSVYTGSQIAPAALVATFLVPHEIPPIAYQNSLFDPACAVKVPRVVCLSPSLLQLLARRSHSPECTVVVVLQASHFVMKPSDKLVRISLFSVHCLDMHGIQSDWREDTCVLGEKTTWDTVHCVCESKRRARRQLNTIKLAKIHMHVRYLTAKVIVVPNPVDLRLEVIKKVAHNPVTTLTVLFIVLMYIVLSFWALHRDETDQFIRDHVIVLPDNDPYDNVCYLVTVFTGSRCGSGTRSNVFVQLRGTQNSSDVHCLSHPHFKTLYRGSISTFLLTTQSDLGDIHSIRVWHDNEDKAPSWYLSRVKVEHLSSRHIWLFMCRTWLSVDTSVDRTFHVTDPNEPLKRVDFFLIDVAGKLAESHMWFSVFSGVIAKGFSRLQRLSCCLAMLLSSLMCNIMFFNLNTQKDAEPRGSRYVRSMTIGLESVVITLPVQVMITVLFTYSQRRPQVTLEEVSPQEHPGMAAASGHWEERLETWHAQETAQAPSWQAEKSPPSSSPGPRQSSVKAAPKAGHRHEKPKNRVSRTLRTNANANNRNVNESPGVPSAQPSSPAGPPPVRKPRLALPWWCVYIAWFLVFATSSVSSFFIVFYGLTYGYEKSTEWLFASFCSFCQSVFLVQPSKIMLLSSIRSGRLKYCKNLPWISNHRYSEIQLQESRPPPDEVRRRHEQVVRIRGTRMYQPLAEDEVRIFQRKRRVKRRAWLFLSHILAHFLFLALLLSLVGLLRHPDSCYYSQFIRGRFSVDLANVTKLDDIYGWLNHVLLPLFHNDLNPTFLPDSASKILGLPQMRQVRAKHGERACLSTGFVPTNIEGEIHCHPKYDTDPEDTENYTSFWKKVDNKNTKGFTYKPPEKRWVYFSYGLLHTYRSGGYVFYFFPDQQRGNSTLRLRDLRDSHWLDEKTWAVILELTTFNPDISLLCSISVTFEVSQLGVVNASMSAHSFALSDFHRKPSTEIYVCVATLLFFLAYVAHEGYVIVQERASYLTSVFNLLNLTLKCLLAMWIVLFCRKYFLATGILQFYASNSVDFIPFHAVSQLDQVMEIVLGFLLFLTILKTLRYSRFFYDVRLAQRVIQTALPGICHVALVVSTCFFMYVAFGYLVFGQHEWSYSNLIHATQTIFSYRVSAFQNTEFPHNRVLRVLFLLSFVLVVICVLANLFQAVILSAYQGMKQPVYEEPSDEAEAMVYLCGKFRTAFGFLPFRSKAPDEPGFFVDMLYGQPDKRSSRFRGLKTRNINERKMVYLVV